MFNEAHVHCHRSSNRSSSSSSSCSHLIFESMAQQAGGTHSWLNPPLHLDRPFAGQKSTRRRWSAIGKSEKERNNDRIELWEFLSLPPTSYFCPLPAEFLLLLLPTNFRLVFSSGWGLAATEERHQIMCIFLCTACNRTHLLRWGGDASSHL
jgi:hypothetical protein